MKLKGLSKEDKIKLGYDLDLKNSYIDYVTKTEKQYFTNYTFTSKIF